MLSDPKLPDRRLGLPRRDEVHENLSIPGRPCRLRAELLSRRSPRLGERRGMIRPVATTAQKILRILGENAPAIRGHGVRSLALFGSAAREDSDLDFIVEFDAKSFDAYMDLKALLERLLGRRVDLVLRDALKPRLRQSVLNEALHAPGLAGGGSDLSASRNDWESARISRCQYFGVDTDIPWDVIQGKLRSLEGAVSRLLRE